MAVVCAFLVVLCVVREVELASLGTCNQPLGIEDGQITDGQMKASSAFLDSSATYGAHRGRLNLGSWPPGYRANPMKISGNPWITVDFQREMIVTGIATQGYGNISAQEWITSYELKYGDYESIYNAQSDTLFTGNSDSSSVHRQDFLVPVLATYIELVPKTWNNNFALRMELYGCKPGTCNQPLGIEDGQITDKQMVASSSFLDISSTYGAHRGRLNLVSWPPGYRANPLKISGLPWMRVDFQREMVVTGIATQGYGNISVQEWLTSYKLKYEDSYQDLYPSIYNEQGNTLFTGNSDSSSIQREDFLKPVLATYIEVEPETWNNNFALRMELYGCKPEYPFVVRLLVNNTFFTLDFANTTSPQYHALKTLAMTEVRTMLSGAPGFLAAGFERFGPYSLPNATRSTLMVEIRVMHLKNYMLLLVKTLKREIGKGSSMFNPKVVETQVPFTNTCPPPSVSIHLNSPPPVSVHLNKNLDQVKFLFSTDKKILSAQVNFSICSSAMQSISSWEKSRAPPRSRIFKSFMKRGLNVTSRTFKMRQAPARDSFFYVSFVLRHASDGRVMAYDYGYILVMQPPPKVKIRGPSRAIKGHGAISLNASTSKVVSRLSVSWYCRRNDELFPEGDPRLVDIPDENFQNTGGCYGYGPGKLSESGVHLSVDADRMDAGQTYVFRVVVSRYSKQSMADHDLTVFVPTNFSIRCTYNCGSKIATNKRMIIESTCAGPLCQLITRYEWSMYKMNQSIPNTWEKLDNLDDMILSKADSPNLVLAGMHGEHKHSLDHKTFYRINLAVFIDADKVKEDQMTFSTNSPPHSDVIGGCSLTPHEGVVLIDKFLVNCSGWHDEDAPLSFVYNYISEKGMVTIKSRSKQSTLKTFLPQGKPSEDFNVTVQVEVFDAFGASSLDVSTVRVTPLDLSHSVLEQVVDVLNSHLENLVKDGDVEQAAVTSLVILSSVQNESLPEEDKNQVSDTVLAQLADVEVTKFHEIDQLSFVVTKATDGRKDMPIESLENTVNLLTSMTNFISENVGNASHLIKDEVQTVGGYVLQAFSNAIVASSSKAAGQTGQTRDKKDNKRPNNENGSEKAKELTEDALSLIDKLGSALLSTKVIGEKPTTFISDSITMMLDRESPSDMGNKTLGGEGGKGEVILPSSEALFGNDTSRLTSVDAQMLLLKQNPYTWGKSSEDISSSVIQFDFKTENGTTLNISGLRDPVGLFLPIKNQTKGFDKNPKQHLFVKTNNSLRYQEIFFDSDAKTAFVELRPQNNTIFEVFVSSGERPTPENHSFSKIIPDFSSCGNYSTDVGYVNCTSNPYMFSFSSLSTGRTGVHFIGIGLYENFTDPSNGTEQRTRRRAGTSCTYGSGRQKRSCIGVKDPPTTPPPTPMLIIPKYNASTDVNYTMSVTMTGCLYWSEKKQAWTSEGCKVGPQTTNTQLHCLCTHLSAFGGDIFVAPNPIDFDKVWKEFLTLGETKNYVVLLTVCAIFGLYFIGLAFARRADRKDRLKVVANVLLTDSDAGGYKYNISIQTGMWNGFGTTATVGMMITGENGDSGVISLTCLAKMRKLFARASVNNFTLSLPGSLGKLTSVDIWHDNGGRHPAWYLQQIMITDEQTEDNWYFFANTWLAVDKGPGQIEINLQVAEGKDLTAFKPLFFSRAARSLGEGHLWISVFTRPPHNPFTRCQRLSCCLSFLFTAMITNAMFYQFGQDATDTFKFGPLVMSWTQIKIGIQSSVIAIPINVLVVLIFRNIRQSSSSDIYDAKGESRTSGCLPYFFIYVAWVLCIPIALTGASFTIFYSLQWGADIANEWLTSILVSLVQDVLITQPIKVIAFASLLSLIIKKPPEQDIVFGPSFFKRSNSSRARGSSLRGKNLDTVKDYSIKLKRAFDATKEIISFLIFGFLLMVICYGNQDPARYRITKSINDVFGDFGEVIDNPSLWGWIDDVLVPGLYDATWYNGQPFEYDEGFISSREGLMLGMPRLRQLRIAIGSYTRCPENIFGVPLSDPFSRCLPAYSSDDEDKTPFNLPGWIPLTNDSTARYPYDLCPKPWRYLSKQATQSLPYQALRETYGGGGYVADLGYNKKSAEEVVRNLQAHNWVDDLTAAVIIEFTVFNPSTSLFSIVKGVWERLPTGAAIAELNVKTFALYPSSNAQFQSFYEVCQLLFLIVIVVFFIAEMIKFFREKKYLRQVWNWVELLLLAVTFVAIVMSFLKGKYTSIFVREVQKNPYETASSDRIVQWSDQETLWLSLAIFILTFKLLRLVRFNYHVCQMQGTLKRSARPVLSFAFVFAIAMVAFSFFGFVGFGSNADIFSTLYQAFQTNLLMSIGKQIDYVELYLYNSSLQLAYFVFYFLIILCVLVNIFVAALVDSYAEVRDEHGDTFADASLGDFMLVQLFKNIRQFPAKFVAGVKFWLSSKSEDLKKNKKFRLRRRAKQDTKFSPNVVEAKDESSAGQDLVPLKSPVNSSEISKDGNKEIEVEKVGDVSDLIEDYYLMDARNSLAEIAAELRSSICS